MRKRKEERHKQPFYFLTCYGIRKGFRWDITLFCPWLGKERLGSLRLYTSAGLIGAGCCYKRPGWLCDWAQKIPCLLSHDGWTLSLVIYALRGRAGRCKVRHAVGSTQHPGELISQIRTSRDKRKNGNFRPQGKWIEPVNWFDKITSHFFLLSRA